MTVPILIVVLSVWIGILLMYLRMMKNARAAELAREGIAIEQAVVTQWNARSICRRMALSGFWTAAVVGVGALWERSLQGRGRIQWTPMTLGGSLVISAVIGALLGYLFVVRDLVAERRSKGQRVNLVLRAYFNSGFISLFLWIGTGVIAAVGGIVVYGAVLVARVGPAR
jgi:hypothetical protein